MPVITPSERTRQDPSHGPIGNLRLTANVGWNLLGIGLPLLVALAAIPLLLKGIGPARFGLLSIIWALITYFTLFDLGLGRAITKLVAERLGDQSKRDIPPLVITALAMISVLGIFAAVVLASLTPLLVDLVLHAPEQLRREAYHAFTALAVCAPFLVVSSALIGLLQAHQNFRAASVVRMTTGSLTFLAPLLALHWTTNLAILASSMAGARLIAALGYAIQCIRLFPEIWHNGYVDRSFIKPLLQYGTWFTVSNVVGPFMVYLDRFLIGAALNLAAVAYYTTPYEVVTRLWIFPAALVDVLFPAFSTNFVSNSSRIRFLFRRACLVTLIAMALPVSLIVLFAREALTVWLGSSFGTTSSDVLRWLAVGVLINSVARLPQALIQSAGRPDIVAKLHLIELPIYITALWGLLSSMGVVGAAVAWTSRVALDALAFFWFAGKVMPELRSVSMRTAALTVLVSLLVGMLAFVSAMAIKLGFAFAILFGAVIVTYRWTRSIRFRANLTDSTLGQAAQNSVSTKSR